MSHVAAVRLSDNEWLYFIEVRDRHNISIQELLHAIILDALVDEGYDALRREQPEGCADSGEISESRGGAAA